MRRAVDSPQQMAEGYSAGDGGATSVSGSPRQLAERLGAARPRLVRMARGVGIPADAAEDVAQEALLEAWRHRDAIRDIERLDAWLSAICRHVCRRVGRARGLAAQRLSAIAVDAPPDETATCGQDDAQITRIVAPDSDPAEWLDRQDLETLLDQALGHLSPDAREIVEQCYLRESPQREVAARLELSISALEARLQRARRQLRTVLAGALRKEAEAHGLVFSADEQVGWRASRIWCPTCASHRLHGAFELLPGGGINLHLRCRGCGYQVNSGGVVPLEGLTSFRPAYKRTLAFAAPYITQGIATGRQTCPLCGALCPMRLEGPGSWATSPYSWPGLTAVLECSGCGIAPNTLAALLVWARPEVQRFQTDHPRSINEPEMRMEYQGQPALQVRLADISSAARLTLFVHSQTLELLACFAR